MALEFVLEAVDVGQVVAVVGGLGADEDVVVVDDLLQAEQRVVIVVGGREQVVHLLVGDLPENR